MEVRAGLHGSLWLCGAAAAGQQLHAASHMTAVQGMGIMDKLLSTLQGGLDYDAFERVMLSAEPEPIAQLSSASMQDAPLSIAPPEPLTGVTLPLLEPEGMHSWMPGLTCTSRPLHASGLTQSQALPC